MNTKEIDALGAQLIDRVEVLRGAKPKVATKPIKAFDWPADAAVRTAPKEVIRAASFPDHFALGHAIAFEKDAGHRTEVVRLEALKERSSAYGADGYGTHLPILAAVMQAAAVDEESTAAWDGNFNYTAWMPVLECGAGFYSTILLNAMCRSVGRRLFTLDSDAGWLAKLEFLRSDNHVLQHVVGWLGDPWGKAIDAFQVERWSIVFIDHREKYDRIEAMRDKADFIVVHDTCNTFHAGVDELLETFTYRYDFTEMSPCTTVVSMTKDFHL